MHPAMRTLVITVVAIAGCTSERQPPVVAKPSARNCAAPTTPALPALRTLRGTAIVDPFPSALAPSISNERAVDVMHGSTMTLTTTVADVHDPRPLPCTFTAVFADRTCRLEATGKRQATRSTTGPVGIAWGDARWALLVEVADAAGCMRNGSPGHVVVEGSWSDLRLVELATAHLGFSDEDGTRTGGGATRDADGTDLMPEIRRWPRDEQAAYLEGPRFDVSHTQARDLYWYASWQPDRWVIRLRDGAGTLLFESPMPSYKDMYLPLAVVGPLLRHGTRLYYFGEAGAVRVR
jgi:hypothetical protein